MALIRCPECGKDVSSLAVSCPHCGIALSGPSGVLRPAPPSMPSAEPTLWEGKPSLRLLVGQGVGLLLLVAVGFYLALSVAPALQQSWGNPKADTHGLPLVLSALLCCYFAVRAISIAVNAIRLRSVRYRLTNQRLVVERGLLSRTLSEVDLRQVDDLVFRPGPLDRLLGIGSISVVSSDRTQPHLQLLGVMDPRGTRELIRTQVYAATQRQLFTRSS
jgi:uncharacterized membrane protein YdbT with pleckstrin-like domain